MNALKFSSLTLDESAASYLDVESTNVDVPASVHGGLTSSTVQLDGTGGAFSFVGASPSDHVIIGNGSLSSIAGPVNISNNSPTGTSVTVDDHNDLATRQFVINSSSISGSGLPTINYSGVVKSLYIEDGIPPLSSPANTLEFDSLPTGLTATTATALVNSRDSITGAAKNSVRRINR
jgi:hypothetical protein